MRIPMLTRPPADRGDVLYDERLPSTAAAKASCLAKMLDRLAALGAAVGEEPRTHLRLVLDELLVNAMEHGNGWRKGKRVRVRLTADGRRWTVRIEDEGRGFDPRRVPDPREPDAILRDRGRGLLLIQALVDRFVYYDGGRGVCVSKRFGTETKRSRGRRKNDQ